VVKKRSGPVLTSKIINMAERLKDNEDLLLESMFASDPIADDGFSAMIEKKVRRRLWLRRMVLPVATLIGALVSYKPLAGLVTALASLTSLLPQEILDAPQELTPQLPMIVLGAMLLATCLLGLRALED
jgi:hypothetical protein